MQEGWYRFWAIDAWRSWIERRRQWWEYSRDLRTMRTRLMALEERERAAQADHEVASRNAAWVSGLAPRDLPIELAPGEIGLGTVEGVELHELRSHRGKAGWTFVDRGVVHFTNRRMVYDGSETVSFPFADVTDDVVRKRGWELSVTGREERHLLAGPVEQLRVMADGVIDGIGGTDPRYRWTSRRADAHQRLQVVAEARTSMRSTYEQMDPTTRPISPGWVPAGALALAAVVGTLGSIGTETPPPPTVMSVQVTTTTMSSSTLADVSDEALRISANPSEVCHDSYVGVCVPVGVADVDCRDTGEDGPYFVGPVTVVGEDVYQLDDDGDGAGCEAG